MARHAARPDPMTGRAGAVSLSELVLVATLFALVLGGLGRFARDHTRLAMMQRDGIRFEEAVRTASVVLGADLRFLTDLDLGGFAGDSVRIRAFRGGGPVCGGEATKPLVAYRGMRDPDPGRDSVLMLGDGSERVAGLTSIRHAPGCGGSLELSLDAPPGSVPPYLLVFETGAYHLSDGAFRYRRGEGGRQPLTEPVLGDLGFESMISGLRLRVAAHPDSLPSVPPETRFIRVWLLNRDGDP